MHSAHPALQSEHQGPIRESACSTTSPSSWPCCKQLLTKQWNHMFTLPPPHARARACRADEASQYLTAYKQSEHRPLRLIREHVNRTPGAILRIALTSILRITFSRPFSFLSRLTGHLEDRASRRSHSQMRCSSRGSLASVRKRSPGSTSCSRSPSTWARRRRAPCRRCVFCVWIYLCDRRDICTQCVRAA